MASDAIETEQRWIQWLHRFREVTERQQSARQRAAEEIQRLLAEEDQVTRTQLAMLNQLEALIVNKRLPTCRAPPPPLAVSIPSTNEFDAEEDEEDQEIVELTSCMSNASTNRQAPSSCMRRPQSACTTLKGLGGHRRGISKPEPESGLSTLRSETRTAMATRPNSSIPGPTTATTTTTTASASASASAASASKYRLTSAAPRQRSKSLTPVAMAQGGSTKKEKRSPTPPATSNEHIKKGGADPSPSSPSPKSPAPIPAGITRLRGTQGTLGTPKPDRPMTPVTPSGRRLAEEVMDAINTTNIAVVKVTSDTHLEQIVDSVHNVLTSSESDWSLRVDAIRKLEGAVLGGAVERTCWPALLRSLQGPLVAQVNDLRSGVVKEACQLLILLSKRMLSAFQPFTDYFIPHLIHLTKVTIKIISESGNAAVLALLGNSGVRKCVPTICEAAQDKHRQVRMRAAQYFNMILEVSPTRTLDPYVDQLEETLKSCLLDGLSEVRAAARYAYWAFQEHYTDRAQKVLQSLSPATQKQVINRKDQGTHRRCKSEGHKLAVEEVGREKVENLPISEIQSRRTLKLKIKVDPEEKASNWENLKSHFATSLRQQLSALRKRLSSGALASVRSARNESHDSERKEREQSSDLPDFDCLEEVILRQLERTRDQDEEHELLIDMDLDDHLDTTLDGIQANSQSRNEDPAVELILTSRDLLSPTA